MSRSRLISRASLFLSVIWLTACSASGASSRSAIAEIPASAIPTSGNPITGVQSSENLVTRTPPQAASQRAELEDLGPAPELENQVWLNTDRPLRLKDLRGKVILLDMWTFG